MKTTQFGEHITIDGYNGDRKILDSKKTVLDLLLKLPDKLGMNILQKPSVVSAPDNGLKDPGGWTGFVIIAESHISIHTFPKRGFVSADIYTCKSGMDKQAIVDYFTDTFKLTDIETNFIKRGTRYPVENILEKPKVNSLEKFVVFNKTNIIFGKSSNGYGHSYFAKRDFEIGEIVMKGQGRIINQQTQNYSVQIGLNKHFLPNKWTGKYLNHSCNPNTFVKTREDKLPNLIAMKRIRQGEEITFAYYTSEFVWTKIAHENYVACRCGEVKCKGKILSYSQLTNAEKKKLNKSGQLSKYLQNL